jgi:hypothetical protein
VPVDWIVDCHDRSNNEWVLGSASEYREVLNKSGVLVRKLHVKIEGDDGEPWSGLLPLKATYGGVRLVEVCHKPLQLLFRSLCLHSPTLLSASFLRRQPVLPLGARAVWWQP